MRIYFDTSALAKRYVAETHTDRVLELCERADEIVFSQIGIPELVSTLARLKREKRLSHQQYASLKSQFLLDIGNATTVPLRELIVDDAIVALESFPLRSLDAIHVATAKAVAPDLFVTADHRQATAASALGLPLEYLGP